MNNEENTQRKTAIAANRVLNRFADEREMEIAKALYEPKEEYIVDGKVILLTFDEVVELRKSGKVVTIY